MYFTSSCDPVSKLSILESLTAGLRCTPSRTVRPLYLRWGLPTFLAFFKYCQWVESGSDQGFSYPLSEVNKAVIIDC